jgi:hypothetical protein
MSRWFNTSGPCQADIHYMLSPTTRLPDLEGILQQRSYFVVHAPRQTGKTTAMLALAKQLTATGRYAAVMVSVEVGSAFNHDPSAAELADVKMPYQLKNVCQRRLWSRTISEVLLLFGHEGKIKGYKLNFWRD